MAELVLSGFSLARTRVSGVVDAYEQGEDLITVGVDGEVRRTSLYTFNAWQLWGTRTEDLPDGRRRISPLRKSGIGRACAKGAGQKPQHVLELVSSSTADEPVVAGG